MTILLITGYCGDSWVTALILLARYDGDTPCYCPTPLLASWMLTCLEMNEHQILLQLVQNCGASIFTSWWVLLTCHRHTDMARDILCSSEGCGYSRKYTSPSVCSTWQSALSFFNSPVGIYLFFSLLALNILTSTAFCGQKWEEFVSSAPALLILFCCRYWPCFSVPVAAVCKLFLHKVCHRVALFPSVGMEALGGSFAPMLLSLPICRDAFLFCLCCCSTLQAQGVLAAGAEATALQSQPVPAKLSSAVAGLQTEVLWLFCTWWE